MLQRNQKAAEEGIAEAQLALGLMYGGGSAAATNKVMAQMWLTLAEKNAGAICDHARSAIQRLAGTMSPAEVADAERRAAEWLKEHERPLTQPPVVKGVDQFREAGFGAQALRTILVAASFLRRATSVKPSHCDVKWGKV